MTAIDYPAFPANNVTYTYGAASQRQPGPVGNVVGRITRIGDAGGTEDRLYGPLGEIVRETRAIPIQGNQVTLPSTKWKTSQHGACISFPVGAIVPAGNTRSPLCVPFSESSTMTTLSEK